MKVEKTRLKVEKTRLKVDETRLARVTFPGFSGQNAGFSTDQKYFSS